MLNRLRSLPQGVKASIAFFLASMITSGIAYITTPLYTRLLSSNEFGQVQVYLTWIQICGIVAMFCLSYGVFNNGMVDYPEKRDEYSFSMLILSNIITLCFSAILLGLYPLIKDWLDMDLPLVILMCVLFLVQPAYNFWTAKQRYELKYKWTVVWTVVCAFLSPLVAVLCILIFDDAKLYARIFGAEVTLIAIYALFYAHLAIKTKCRVNTAYWKQALLFNLPLIPHYLSTYLLGSSNKLLISAIEGDAATAYYSVAYSVSTIVMIIWSAINSSLLPHTYENCKKNNYRAISDVTVPILIVFAVLCCMVSMLAPEIVAIMATPDYREAIYVIPPTIGGIFFQVQYYVYANIVYYHKKPTYVMIASVSATVLNIALNYVLISRFGYLAAGYVTLACYLFQATIDYFCMRKVVGHSVYNMRYIGILSLIVVLVSVLSNLIYDSILIRYSIVVGILLAAVLFRGRIVQIVKSLRGNNNDA